MKREELRTLRGQLWLTVGLLGASLALGTGIAVSRTWYESFLRDGFVSDEKKVSDNAKTLLRMAETGNIDRTFFSRLPDKDRWWAYEHWLNLPEKDRPEMPGPLFAVAPEFYEQRVERTLVCGNHDQRVRALRFLELAKAYRSVAMLRGVEKWAQRRRLTELVDAIRPTIERLEKPSATR